MSYLDLENLQALLEHNNVVSVRLVLRLYLLTVLISQLHFGHVLPFWICCIYGLSGIKPTAFDLFVLGLRLQPHPITLTSYVIFQLVV
jgi:hypothetical protein